MFLCFFLFVSMKYCKFPFAFGCIFRPCSCPGKWLPLLACLGSREEQQRTYRPPLPFIPPPPPSLTLKLKLKPKDRTVAQ